MLTISATNLKGDYTPWRAYFDSFSDQFTRTTISQKIDFLGKCVMFGNKLSEIISEYKSNYEPRLYPGLHEDARNTMLGYICVLKGKDFNHWRIDPVLEVMQERQVVKLLTEALKEHNKNFSLKKLIDLYCEKEFNYSLSDAYLRQKEYFNIDLDADIHKKLKTRNTQEGLSDIHSSYNALNEYLKRKLFRNYHNNIVSDLNAEVVMPMTKGIIYYLNKFYPEQDHSRLKTDDAFRRQSTLNLITELIAVLYLNKPSDFELNPSLFSINN